MGNIRVVIVRHGQTDFNVEMRMQGQIDVPLNEFGRRQAAEIAPLIAQMKPLRIVASPLSRTRDTAAAIAKAAGLPVYTDERLLERAFGKLEGLTRAEMEQRYPQLYQQWRDGADADGVESRLAVGERFAQCVRDEVQQLRDAEAARLAADADAPLVIVTHGSAMTNGIAVLLGIDPTNWSGLRGADNCHWSVLIPGKRAPGWRLVEHNTQRVYHDESIISY